MNSKNIRKAIRKKLDHWCDHIDNEDVVNAIKRDAIVTGGALVSLLNGETPNDYDVYFKTLETCKLVAEYYAEKWSELHPDKSTVNIDIEDNRVVCTIRSAGAVMEDDESGIDDTSEPNQDQFVTENDDEPIKENPEIERPKYRPRYFSTNAISLSDKIQIVIRFWGSVEDIHKNYDFVHTTCSYDYGTDNVDLPAKALECIINKELIYQGSKYPLCSIIRTRKFISRGWHINAGEYVKMAMQLNKMDLYDINVFKEQLTGVDSAYFDTLIRILNSQKEKDDTFTYDDSYVITLINKIF